MFITKSSKYKIYSDIILKRNNFFIITFFKFLIMFQFLYFLLLITEDNQNIIIETIFKFCKFINIDYISYFNSDYIQFFVNLFIIIFISIFIISILILKNYENFKNYSKFYLDKIIRKIIIFYSVFFFNLLLFPSIYLFVICTKKFYSKILIEKKIVPILVINQIISFFNILLIWIKFFLTKNIFENLNPFKKSNFDINFKNKDFFDFLIKILIVLMYEKVFYDKQVFLIFIILFSHIFFILKTIEPSNNDLFANKLLSVIFDIILISLCIENIKIYYQSELIQNLDFIKNFVLEIILISCSTYYLYLSNLKNFNFFYKKEEICYLKEDDVLKNIKHMVNIIQDKKTKNHLFLYKVLLTYLSQFEFLDIDQSDKLSFDPIRIINEIKSNKLLNTTQVLKQKEYIVGNLYKLLICFCNIILKKQKHFHKIKIIYIYILFYKQEKKLLGLLLFLNLIKNLENKKKENVNKELKKLIPDLETFILNEYTKIKDNDLLNLNKFLEFCTKSNNFVDKLRKSSHDISKIYEVLKMNRPDFKELKSRINVFIKEHQTIDSDYITLISYKNSSIYLKQIYSYYYTYVINNEKKINKIADDMKYSTSDEKINYMDYHYQNYHTFQKKKKGFFLLTVQKNEIGNIVLASKNAKDIIKYMSSKLINKNIDLFRANFCEGTIKNWINEFYKDPEIFKDSLNNKFGFDYFMTKNKYLILVMNRIRILQSFKYGITFPLFIWPFEFNQKNNYSIFVYDFDNGDIIGINSMVFKMFKINSKYLENNFKSKNNFLNMKKLCPEIMEKKNIDLMLQFKKVDLFFYSKEIVKDLKKLETTKNLDKFQKSSSKYKEDISQIKKKKKRISSS